MINIAVIPSNGRNILMEAIDAIMPQVDLVVIVRTSPMDCCDWSTFLVSGIEMVEDLGPPNISRWWNAGLNAAQEYAMKGIPIGGHDWVNAKWNVAVINDDVIVPEGWLNAVTTPMRGMHVAAGCSGGTGPMPILHTRPRPVSLDTRMQGFAFVLAGEKRLRADENLVWWFGDDDLDWRSRQAGGMVMVPGYHVDHRHPNGQMTPELHAQTAADAETFMNKWGMRPW